MNHKLESDLVGICDMSPELLTENIHCYLHIQEAAPTVQGHTIQLVCS